MKHLERIEKALEYIDGHLDEALRLEEISGVFHFSPYYFHRMLSAVVGRPMTAYMRERRLQKACMLLSATKDTVLSIGLECGFDTAQAFSRAFRNQFGVAPSHFRKYPAPVVQPSARELVAAFRRKLRGGVNMEPRIIQRPKMYIAGVSGDGSKTGDIWAAFMALQEKKKLQTALSQDGYEVRVHGEEGVLCHVGLNTPTPQADAEYAVFPLPATLYAAFDVYVAEGYASQNGAMEEWLAASRLKYAQRLLEGKEYVVEYYDERFHGDASDSIVEIWVSIMEVSS